MFKTPEVPDWIRTVFHPRYRNIYSFNLDNRNLWGTETLLGDWDGKYLLIAKDFYPASYIQDAIDRGIRDPYRHNPNAVTNRNLIKTLVHFGAVDDTTTTTDCNFLYASACFLLRDDGVIRGALPDADSVFRISAPVIRFTMDKMPNLRVIVAMGRDAENALKATGMDDTIRKRKLAYFSVSHPSFAMSDADRFAEWKPVLAPPRRPG